MDESLRRRSSAFIRRPSAILLRRNSQAISTLRNETDDQTDPAGAGAFQMSSSKKSPFFGSPSHFPSTSTSRADEKRKSILKPIGSSHQLDSPLSRGPRTETDKIKQELPKPNHTYRYHCEGVVKTKENSALSGHKVEWKTVFDRPLEEMIYPSLQHFDFVPEETTQRLIREKDRAAALKRTTMRPRIDPLSQGEGEASAVEELVPRWQVTVSQDPVAISHKEKDVFDEMSEKGEAYLRKELVEKVRQKEREKRERAMDPFFSLKAGRGKERRKSFQLESSGEVVTQEAAMELYEHLLQPQERREIGRGEGIFVTETAMEGIYASQKATLEKRTSADNAHLMNGIMYYRMRGEINRNEISDKLNAHNRVSHAPKPIKERVSTFMREVDKRGSAHGTTSLEQEAFRNRSMPPSRIGTASAASAPAIAAMDNEELSAMTASKLAESLSSVRNALNSRYSGYDHHEVEGAANREARGTIFMEKVRDMRIAASVSADATATAGKPTTSQGGKRDREREVIVNELSLLQHDLERATGISLGDITRFDTGTSSNRSDTNSSRQLTPSASTKSRGKKTVPSSPLVQHNQQRLSIPPTTVPSISTSKQKSASGAALDFDELYDEDAIYESKKRTAQDMLLLTQLESGVFPEPFLKKNQNSKYFAIDLSGYGIGDVHGLCLAESIRRLDSLGTLGLGNNRLSSKSIGPLLQNIPAHSLLHLDLSHNNLRGHGAEAVAQYFTQKVSLVYLDISKCNMTAFDVGKIFQSLMSSENTLQDLNISKNKVDQPAMKSLAEFILHSHCKLVSLDLSWNEVGVEGAGLLCEPLSSNWTITKLDLSACSLGDSGCQHIAAAVGINQTLRELNLSHNSMMSSSCFVFAKELRNHRSLQLLDLSTNPLGEAGGRAFFRAILAGLSTFVSMRDCSFNTEEGIFNYSYPASDSPYELDMSVPYNAAVLQELMSLFASDKANFTLVSIMHKENPKGQYTPINIAAANGEIVMKGSSLKWSPPRTGYLKIVIAHASIVPTVEKAIPATGLSILTNFIIKSKPTDRLAWLRLLCEDVFLTTTQAQGIIDNFAASRVIGVGGITTVDTVGSLWTSILDTENKYDFLCSNVTPHERRELVYALTFEQFKFNWINPTSHWRIDLSNKAHRAVMLNLIAINMVESEFSKNLSRRADTSQKGNWFNFRNEVLNSRLNEITFTKEFFDNLPARGVLEFDYVSTTRPKRGPGMRGSTAAGMRGSLLISEPNSRATSSHSTKEMIDSLADLEPSSTRATSANNAQAAGADSDHQQARSRQLSASAANSMSEPTITPKPSTMDLLAMIENVDKQLIPQMSQLLLAAEKVSKNVSYAATDSGEFEITDEDFYQLLNKLGLLASHKQDKSGAIYSLMELQLASTKYYFPTAKALQIIESFNQEEALMPAKVTICLFSRIRDLHNFDIIMRNLDRRCQDEVILRLGWLNIANPLKPAFDKYVINLKPRDNRFFTITLLEIAAQESSDQLREDPSNEVNIVNLYGSFYRLQNDPRPETLKFNYGDVGERTNNVNWNLRRDALKKFLVGTHPMDRTMYNVVTWYKEMEEAGTLTVGPLDLQYANHLKVAKSQKKSSASRSAQSSRSGGGKRRSFLSAGDGGENGSSSAPPNRRTSVGVAAT